MDKNHLFNDHKTGRMHYANELSEADHNVASMDGIPVV